MSSDGNFALVHNGIIENYEGIKNFLSTKGYSFSSQTDSEALVNLIAYHYAHRTEDDAENRFMEAVRKALLHVEGTYGIAVLCRFNDGEIVAARKGSPLLIGVGRNERLVSSDVLGFAGRASNVIYLEDNQIASVTADNCDIVTIGNKPVSYTVGEIDWKLESAGDCRHFMQKEIMEQPTVLENAIRGRISDDNSTAVLNGLNMTPTQMRQIDRILFCACGTAWHACLVAEYLIEKYARIPVEVEYASEFRYRNAPLDKNTLVFVISQSGETIDTLEALRESKRKGFKTLAITNSVGSTISRESDGGLYQYAGKEVGVASTKAFTSQIAICLLIALYIGRMRDLSFSDGRAIVDAIKSLPAVVAQVLKLAPRIEKIAKKYAKFSDFLFVGRLSEFPVALEGALKLKEISYIHAEGYPAAEMKHVRGVRDIRRNPLESGLERAGDKGAQGADNRRHRPARGLRGDRRRHRRRAEGPRLHKDGCGDNSHPAAGVLRRPRKGLRRGQAPKSRKGSDGGVGGVAPLMWALEIPVGESFSLGSFRFLLPADNLKFGFAAIIQAFFAAAGHAFGEGRRAEVLRQPLFFSALRNKQKNFRRNAEGKCACPAKAANRAEPPFLFPRPR